MELVTIVLATFVLLAVLHLVASKRRIVRMLDELPGPRKYPVVGNLMDIAVPREKILGVVANWDKNYGPIYTTWFGPALPNVHIMKPDYAEIILSSNKHIRKGMMYDFLHPWLGTGLLTSTGAKWFSHRKLLTPTFHFQVLDNFVSVFNTNTEILVERLKEKADTGEVVNIYPFITLCALDIICESSMGTKINAQIDETSEYVTALTEVLKTTIERFQNIIYHPDFIFYHTPLGKRYKNALAIIHGFTNDVIRQRKEIRKRAPTDDTAEVDDMGRKKKKAFLDMLLDAASTESVPMTDEELREEVDTFMFEGHDTTTVAMCWLINLLGNNPDIQEKLYEEQLSVLGNDKNKQVTIKELGEMKYLDRATKEGLRMFPSVPIIARSLDEDVQIGKYKIPAGIQCAIHILRMGYDPITFPDPYKFNPDRFLSENKNDRNPYSYVPFSAGPRNCIGQKFANLEEKTVLSYLIRNFKFVSLEKPHDVPACFDLVLRPKDGIKVKIMKRA